MTGSELYTLLVELVGDSPSETWFYATVNAVKAQVEEMRAWSYLMKTDATQSRSASDTWLTDKTLPADFASPLRLTVGDSQQPYDLVPYLDAPRYKDVDGTWHLDMAAGKFRFSGSASTTGTAYLRYKRFTPDIAAGTSPVFPDRFHPILAYEAAKRWFAKDQSERALAWNGEHAEDGNALLTAMEAWDDSIKKAEANSAALVSEFAIDVQSR